MKIVILKAAEAELLEARTYHENQRAGLGNEFTDAYEEAMDRILQFPEAWGLIWKRVRCCIFKRFEYGIVYVVRDETLLVLAVMHPKRRPGFGRSV